MRRICALAAALALLPLSGCGLGRGIYANYRPVEDLQPVLTLGLDAGPVLSAAAAPTPGGSPTILRRAAASIPSGLDALQQRTPRGQLYFAHAQYIVLGQSFAAGGVDAVLDFIERDIHTRMGAQLFVVRGGTAEALITGSGADWNVGDVLATVAAETEKRGDSHVFDARETAVALSEYGGALVCALKTVDTAGSVYSPAPGRAAVPDGYGILRDGALIGFLDGTQAQAASLMCGVLGTVTREISLGGGTVTLELRCGAPEIGLSDGVLFVRAAPSAVIAGADAAVPLSDADTSDALAAALNAALQAELTQVLARAQAENCDFLALQRALRRQGFDPAALPADWLTSLPVRVEVRSEVRRSYDMTARAGTDGGAA